MGAKLRHKHRMDALGAILDYQFTAWESGEDALPECFATIYKPFSEHGSRVARLMAAIDAQNAQAILQDSSTDDAEEEASLVSTDPLSPTATDLAQAA